MMVSQLLLQKLEILKYDDRTNISTISKVKIYVKILQAFIITHSHESFPDNKVLKLNS